MVSNFSSTRYNLSKWLKMKTGSIIHTSRYLNLGAHSKMHRKNPTPRILDFTKHTGKSLSEALIFASINPQYDDELQVQYMKIPSSNLGRTCCVQTLFLTFRTIFVHNMFSHVLQKEELLTKIYLYNSVLVPTLLFQQVKP